MSERLQVPLDKESIRYIKWLSKQKELSVAATAKYLIEQAIEMDEDIYYSKLAEERHSDNPDDYVSYDEVIKKYL